MFSAPNAFAHGPLPAASCTRTSRHVRCLLFALVTCFFFLFVFVFLHSDTDSVFHGVNAPNRLGVSPIFLIPNKADGTTKVFDPNDSSSIASRLLFERHDDRGQATTPPADAEADSVSLPAGSSNGSFIIRHADGTVPPESRSTWDDMRLSISWKAFVFSDDAGLALHDSEEDQLTPDMVFDMFEQDLRRNGNTPPPRSDVLAFAMAIVRAYNHPYFLPSNAWNVCFAIDVAFQVGGSRARGFMQTLMSPVCG